MGANASYPAGNTTMSPHVQAFHSMERWKSYLDASKDSSHLTVVDFTGIWCGPCRIMDQVLNELADNLTDVVFLKIDVDELREVALAWGVETLPTFLLLKRGLEVDRVVGANKEELRNKIEKHRIAPPAFTTHYTATRSGARTATGIGRQLSSFTF